MILYILCNLKEGETMYTEIKMESTFADFRMKYQAILDDIKFIRGRKWAVTYYLLLLYAAIIGFSKAIGLDQTYGSCGQKGILFTIALGVAALGIYFIYDMQRTLARYRRNITRTLPYLSKDFERFEIEGHKERYGEEWFKNYTSWWKDWRYTLVFMAMMMLGLVFVYSYLFLVLGC